MRTLLLIASLLTSTTSYAEIDCNIHKIYCKILKLKPKVDKTWAMEFSNKLVAGAKRSNINPSISLAILMQESSLTNVNTFKKDEHVEKKCTEKSCTKIITQVNKVVDLSIAQININTAIHYKCDIEKLFFFDEDEALECHFRVLKDKIKMCNHLGDLDWSCYHSTTEIHRIKYVDLVSRYL